MKSSSVKPFTKSTLRVVLIASAVLIGSVAEAQLLAPLATKSALSNSPILRVGTQQWSAQRFAWLLEAGDLSGANDPQVLGNFVDRVAEQRVLADKAEAAGLADYPRVAERLALARDSILAEEERERLRRLAPVTAAAVKSAFDAKPTDYDELELSQILVRVTEPGQQAAPGPSHSDHDALALIKSIQQQLKAGGSFDALAVKYSEDKPSAAEGGQLPTIFAKDLKPEFRPVVLRLRSLEVSAPVRAADGYHLIRLNTRTRATFEARKQLLEFNLQDAWAQQQIEQARKTSPVHFDLQAWLDQRERLNSVP